MAADNKSLGRFILDGIPTAPRGVPQIEVTFDINADGMLNVSAQDKATGNQQAMQIIPSSGLSDEEIEQMVQEAEEHASEDEARKASVEARNHADTAVYSAEKFLRENGENVPEANQDGLRSQIEVVRTALAGDDLEAIEREGEKLEAAMQEAGAAMYRQQQTAGNGVDGTGPVADEQQPDEEDVIEGEFSDA